MEPLIQDFDVVICGGGPAGSTCALALRESGLNIALLEKHTHPRDKICGDAIAAYVPNVLRTINPQIADQLDMFTTRVPVNICRIVGPNGKFQDITYSKSGFIARRIHWDNFLFQLAAQQKNTTVLEGHAVTDVERNEFGDLIVSSGSSKFRARLVIGCDGANSMVRKKLTDVRMHHHHHAGAVRAYYKNVTGVPAMTFELHFLKGFLPGYFWIFPLGETITNVGLGLLSSKISKEKVSLRETMEKIVKEHPHIAHRFRNATVEGKIEGFGLPLGSRKVPLSGDNFMLCGDAGSLIDPLSGEGIGQAMVSGRYAGWHAKKCFEQNDFSSNFMKAYDEQVYAKFWKKHRLNYSIRELISGRDWLFNAIVNLSSQSNLIKKMLVKAVM